MALIIRATSPHNGVEVRCSDRYWRDHVEKRHPVLAGYAAHVQELISNPLAVYQSPVYVDRHLLYGVSTLPSPYDRGYIRVIVEYKRSWRGVVSGLLISAYLVNGPGDDEVMIWPQT